MGAEIATNEPSLNPTTFAGASIDFHSYAPEGDTRFVTGGLVTYGVNDNGSHTFSIGPSITPSPVGVVTSREEALENYTEFMDEIQYQQDMYGREIII